MEDAKVEDVTSRVNIGESGFTSERTAFLEIFRNFAEDTSRGPQLLLGWTDPLTGDTSSRAKILLIIPVNAFPFVEGTNSGLQLPRGCTALQLPQEHTAFFAEGALTSEILPEILRINSFPFAEGTNRGLQGWTALQLPQERTAPFVEGALRSEILMMPVNPSRLQFPLGRSAPFGTLPLRDTADFVLDTDFVSDIAPNDIDIEMGFDLNIEGADSQGESTSHRFDIDTEKGGTHSDKGGTHSVRHVRGRLANMADLLFGLNIQGAVSLGGYLTLTGNGTSSPKDVFYLVVFLYVLGFLAALGGKLFCNPRMGVIGSVATVVAFLINMGLLIIYKI